MSDNLQSSSFDVVDVPKQCPTYFTALLKKKNDLSAKEFAALQSELEGVLVSLNKRREILLNEITPHQDKKPEKTKVADVVEKRKSTSGEKTGKKFKNSNGKVYSSAANHQKSKNVQLPKPSGEFSEPLVDVPKVQKTEAPSRFWSLVEPYCADITQDDIKMLQDWIASHDDDYEYQDIPPLGEHFANRWIKEDILEEMKEGSKSVECPKGFIGDDSSNTFEADDLIENAKIERFYSHNSTVGTLTERLVSALVEENLMTSLDDELSNACTIDDSIAKKPNSLKSPSLSDYESLEIRLLKDLINNDFLSGDEEFDSHEDQLLVELKKLQVSIKPVCEYNKLRKKKLLMLAKSEMKKQEVRINLQECDAKVMECYRAMGAARLKKKKLNKKEQEQVFSLLQRRKKLMAELESVH